MKKQNYLNPNVFDIGYDVQETQQTAPLLFSWKVTWSHIVHHSFLL